MMIETITVNQWRVKDNAARLPEGVPLEPVVCVNRYEFRDPATGEWGPKIGETEHHHEMPVKGDEVTVVYDPVNKTPCGASCWMEVRRV